MNDLTIVGTITFDRLHFRDHTQESFGGIPWFAIEFSQNEKIKIGILTNVGENFPMEKIPSRILKASKVNLVGKNTTTLDIFPDQRGVPAKVKNFTGEIQHIDLSTGKVVIVSPLFQEISLNSIKKLKPKFTTIVVDIQGFTRPPFKPNMRLSDDIKTEPKELQQLCKIADAIKFSENEINVVLPRFPLTKKIETLHSWGLKNIVITKSDKGCLISTTNSQTKTLSTKSITTSDTIGAGDKLLILLGTFLAKDNTFEDSVIKAQNKLHRMMEAKI